MKRRPMRQWLGCLAITTFSVLAFAQELTPEMRAELDRRVNFHRVWDGRLNSPGAELRGVEMLREKYPGGYIVRYEFQAKGLPTELDYDFLTLPTMASRPDELHSTGQVSIDKKDGRVVDGPSDPRGVILPHPAPGEPYRFALISKDGKHKAFVTILPNPIEASDRGCTVSVTRLMPHFELAFVQAAGFAPGNEIAVHGNSEGEVHDFKMKTNADGKGETAVLPARLGKSKGKIEMQFTGSNCAPKVSFKWGATEDGQPYQ